MNQLQRETGRASGFPLQFCNMGVNIFFTNSVEFKIWSIRSFQHISLNTAIVWVIGLNFKQILTY